MAIIYRVYDNLLGREREIFVMSFDSAKEVLKNIHGVDYMDGEYYIGGMDCQTYVTEDSIDVSRKERVGDILYHCGVEPLELPFEVKNDSFWVLYLIPGYASTMIYGDKPETRLIGYYSSKKSGRKYAARTKWLKRFPRAWVRQGEEAQRKDHIYGHGMDYLNLKKIKVYT